MHDVGYFCCLKHILGLVEDTWILIAIFDVIVFTSKRLQAVVVVGVDFGSVRERNIIPAQVVDVIEQRVWSGVNAVTNLTLRRPVISESFCSFI
jgi:hypothetical protein